MPRASIDDAKLRLLVRRAARSARTRGIAFGLTVAGLQAQWRAQRGRCALTGLHFHDESDRAAFVKQPFAPSLDRIDSAQGYVDGNVQIVLTVVNFAKGQWTLDVLRRIAQGIVATERNHERAWYRAREARIAEAEAALDGLSGPALDLARRSIAGLKASMTKGPSGTTGAARRAKQARAKCPRDV